jgi:hypothetical protein
MPAEVVRNLVRAHLIDHVSGQAPGLVWPDSSIRRAELTVRILDRRGELITIELRGAAAAERQFDRATFGYDVALYGQAVYDADREQFRRFDLIATGLRATQRDHQPPDIKPMGVAFTLPEPNRVCEP